MSLKVENMNHLKQKFKCGDSHLITQFFLDNNYFYAFKERTEIVGIHVLIEAGIISGFPSCL